MVQGEHFIELSRKSTLQAVEGKKKETTAF